MAPFFADLTHDALHRVDARTSLQGIEAGQVVHLAGHRADRLHVGHRCHEADRYGARRD